MYDAVHHAEPSKISTLLQGVPAEVCHHLCDTAGSAVVIFNKSGCSSLDHINLVVGFIGGWCPGCSGIFHYGTDECLVGGILCSLWCRSHVPLRKPMVEFAFFVTWSACLLQDRSLLMVTPKYFASVLTFSFWLCMV